MLLHLIDHPASVGNSAEPLSPPHRDGTAIRLFFFRKKEGERFYRPAEIVQPGAHLTG
jgi:hypothetical protein